MKKIKNLYFSKYKKNSLKTLFFLCFFCFENLISTPVTNGNKNVIVKGSSNQISLIDLVDSQLENKINNDPLTWNLPAPVSYYIERKDLTNQIWSKFTDYNRRSTAILAGLHGLGGIGKTTLAINTIHNPWQNYEFRGWFSSETRELLKNEYFELGEKLRLFAKDMSENFKIKIVRNWLDSKKSILLVYDNVSDMNTISDFLPQKGHIIITSRNYSIPGEKIEIDVMKMNEALNLFNKLIPSWIQKTSNYQKKAIQLLNELSCLPLAVSQAAGYINQNMVSIDDYLKLYESNREELMLDNSLPPGNKHEPVYVTWNINAKAIERDIYGEKALDLLDFISYCYPEEIPLDLLNKYLLEKTNEKSLVENHKIINILRRYSFIKLNQNSLSIHRLVHEWAKYKHSRDKKLKIFRKAISTIKSVYPWKDKSTKDIKFVQKLLPHIESIVSKSYPIIVDIEIVDLLSIISDCYDTLGDYLNSKEYGEKVIAIIEKNYGPKHLKTVEAYHNLARAHIKLGDYFTAERLLKTSLATLETLYGKNHIKIAETLTQLGWVSIRLAKYRNSQDLSERALKIIEKHHGPNHISSFKTLQNLIWANSYLGYYKNSKELAEKALNIVKLHHGPDHVIFANALRNLSWPLIFLGKNIEAKKALQKALKIIKMHYGVNHIETAYILHNLAWAHFYLGNDIEAKQIAEKVLTIREKYFGSHHIRVSYLLRLLGLINCSLGNYFDAERHLERSSAILTKIFGIDHIHTITSLANLGNVYRITKKYSKSKKLLEKAFSFSKEFYKFDNVNIAIISSNLGLLYGDMKDNNKKIENLSNALPIFKKYLTANHLFYKRVENELENISKKTKTSNINSSPNIPYAIMF